MKIIILIILLITLVNAISHHNSRHKHSLSDKVAVKALRRNELKKVHAESTHQISHHRTHLKVHRMKHLTKMLSTSEIMKIAKSKKNLKKLRKMNRKMQRAQYLSKLYMTSNALISMGVRTRAFFNEATEKDAAKLVDAIQKHYDENHNQDTIVVNDSDCENRQKLSKLLTYTKQIWESVKKETYEGLEKQSQGEILDEDVTPQQRKEQRKAREIVKVKYLVESIKQLRLLYENALTIQRMNVLKTQIDDLKIDTKIDKSEPLDYARIQFNYIVKTFININNIPQDLNDFKFLENPITDEIYKKDKQQIKENFPKMFKQFNELYHQFNVQLNHQTIKIKKAFNEPFKNYVDKEPEDVKEEIQKTWDTSDIPNFCWNAKIKIPEVCPPEFPERKGAQCWARCNNLNNAAKLVVPYIGTQTRVVYFERDFAGTCWETCLDPDTKQTLPGCKTGVFTIDTDFPNNEWHIKRSFVNSQSEQSITNYNQDIKCKTGQTRKTWGYMPFCENSEDNPHTCNSMGYKSCGLACAKDNIICAKETSNMVSKTLTGIAKFATLLGVPGISIFSSIGKFSKKALPYLVKLYDAGIDKLDEIAQFKSIMADKTIRNTIKQQNGAIVQSDSYMVNRLYSRVAFTAKKIYLKRKAANSETPVKYQDVMREVWYWLETKYDGVKDLQTDSVKNALDKQKQELLLLNADLQNCDFKEHKKWTLITPGATGVQKQINELVDKQLDSAQSAIIERLKTEATHLTAKDETLNAKEQYKNSDAIDEQIEKEKKEFDKTANYKVDEDGIFTNTFKNFESAQKAYNEQARTFLGTGEIKIVEWSEKAQANYDEKMRELKNTIKKYNLEMVANAMNFAYNLKELYNIGKGENGQRDETVTDQEISKQQRALIKSTFESVVENDPTGIFEIFSAYIYDDCFSAQDLEAEFAQLEDNEQITPTGDQYSWTIQNIKWQNEDLCQKSKIKLDVIIGPNNDSIIENKLQVSCDPCYLYGTTSCQINNFQQINFVAAQNEILKFQLTWGDQQEKIVQYDVPLIDYRDVTNKEYSRTEDSKLIISDKGKQSKLHLDIINQNAKVYTIHKFKINPQGNKKHLALRIIGPTSQMTYQLHKFGEKFVTFKPDGETINNDFSNIKQFDEKFELRLEDAAKFPKIKFQLWSQDYVDANQRKLLCDGCEDGQIEKDSEINLKNLLGSDSDYIANVEGWLTLEADSEIPAAEILKNQVVQKENVVSTAADFTESITNVDQQFNLVNDYITTVTKIPVIKLKSYQFELQIQSKSGDGEDAKNFWLITFVIDQNPQIPEQIPTQLDDEYYLSEEPTDKKVQFQYGGLEDYYVGSLSYPWKFGDTFDQGPMIKRCEQQEKVKCHKIGQIAYPECKEGYHQGSWNPYNCNVNTNLHIYGQGSTYTYRESFHTSEYGRIKKILVQKGASEKQQTFNYPSVKQFETYAIFKEEYDNKNFIFKIDRLDEIINADL